MSHAASRPRLVFLAAGCAVLAAAVAWAGAADVVDVKVKQTESGAYDFSVSVRHADEGWDHYADRWEILTPDRHVLATRKLRHPHVQEQPVTRDLAAVRIPEDIDYVIVRAHDSRHGYGGAEMIVRFDKPPPTPAPAGSTPAAAATGPAATPAGR